MSELEGDLAGGETQQDRSRSASADPRVNGSSTALENLTFDQRYETRHVLAAGGMGEVLVSTDRQIGRDIALKRLLDRSRDQLGNRARFVREARVQGQLEHPAIVPVYDLGIDGDGEAWFTMKRVRGVTLADVLAQLRSGDAATSTSYSLRRLLGAFSSVCLAIDFAHARGVVHRDLKPANIMLGDFGEVYVLDWGVAKLSDVADLPVSRQPRAVSEGDVHTRAGEIIGTVLYMAPEQLLGNIEQIGPRADVWSLGAILFELLALEPLRQARSIAEALADVDREVDARVTHRAPHREVAPELEAICKRAVVRDPGGRYASARELHDALERYLDGDRDLQRRRELAAVHLQRAEDALLRAKSGSPDALEARSLAMREVSRALLLNPTREEDSRGMFRLLLEPPSELPADAREELAAQTRGAVRVAGTVGGLGMASWIFFLPFYVWMGVRDWSLLAAAVVMITACSLFAFACVRWPARGSLWIRGLMLCAALLIALLTRVAGPFMSAPTLAIALAVAGTIHPTGLRLLEIVAFAMIGLVMPLVLELTGVLGPSYLFTGSGMTIVPHMVSLPATATQVTFTLTSITTTVALCLYLSYLRDTLRDTQARLHLHAWNLRQLLPARVQANVDRR